MQAPAPLPPWSALHAVLESRKQTCGAFQGLRHEKSAPAVAILLKDDKATRNQAKEIGVLALKLHIHRVNSCLHEQAGDKPCATLHQRPDAGGCMLAACHDGGEHAFQGEGKLAMNGGVAANTPQRSLCCRRLALP